MATVLMITANPKPAGASFSLTVAEEFKKTYKQQNPADEIVELDVYHMDLPLYDEDVFSGFGKLTAQTPFGELTAAEQQKIGRLNEIVDQFVAADKYIFVTPFWNFGLPPMMKAYIDAVSVVGKTFKYTENGSVGLLAGKPAVHIQARGGFYSEGPAAAAEHGDSYLQTVFAFYGLEAQPSIIIEGVAVLRDQVDSLKESAIMKAREAALAF